MPYPQLTSKDTSSSYFKNNEYGYNFPFIFTTIDCEPYIMAKSVVKGVIEKDYKFGTDPYIERILKLNTSDVTHLDIDSDRSLILKVWGHNNGHFKDVVFVKVSALLLSLKVIFPELVDEMLNDISNQMNFMIDKLSK